MLPAAQMFVSVLPDGKAFNSTVYTFANAGDEIPMHVHQHWHDCKVVAGAVRIYDQTGKELLLKAGELAGLTRNNPHAIQATQAGTVTVHTSEPGA
jgi:quercetin dioxygenase-like cupin family protein